MRLQHRLEKILFAAFAAILLFTGCPKEKDDTPLPGANTKNKHAGSISDPYKKLEPDPGDYFPMRVGNSWSYRIRQCHHLVSEADDPDVPEKICTKDDVHTLINEKRTIDGKEVFLLQSGDTTYEVSGKGYIDEGDYVYVVLIKDEKIIHRSIAGKHDLKPGDSWNKTFFGGIPAETTLTCGEPEFVNVPSDEIIPLNFKAICCSNGLTLGPQDKDYYQVCYTANLGRIAEYAPNADIEAELFTHGLNLTND